MFDFDRSNNITKNHNDFVGSAMHEIGHLLGCVRSLDLQTSVAPYVLDLFRVSQDGSHMFSKLNPAYFSLAKSIKLSNGNNDQASHWDGSDLIMNATSYKGVQLKIQTNDLKGFDVIGWNVI